MEWKWESLMLSASVECWLLDQNQLLRKGWGRANASASDGNADDDDEKVMTMIKTKMKTKRKRRAMFGRESQRSVREQI